MKYIVHPPEMLRSYYKNVTWRIPVDEKKLFITFDDGPIPDITPWALDLLSKYNAKATFFCIGRNVERHPEVFSQILDEGHKVGNHSYSHVRGMFKDHEEYLADIELGQKFIKAQYFRPPHGRIKRNQVEILKNQYTIILWDVLCMDFDTKLTPEKCWKNVVNYTKPGAIVVFHDSVKAEPRMKYALEKTLDHYGDKGFQFDVLP